LSPSKPNVFDSKGSQCRKKNKLASREKPNIPLPPTPLKECGGRRGRFHPIGHPFFESKKPPRDNGPFLLNYGGGGVCKKKVEKEKAFLKGLVPLGPQGKKAPPYFIKRTARNYFGGGKKPLKDRKKRGERPKGVVTAPWL